MKYLFFKICYKAMWLKVRQNDVKRRKKETLPSNVNVFTSKFSVKEHPLRKKKKLKFNIYSDENTKNKPVIIDIHGGGWAYGNKDSNTNFCFHLVKLGFNVASLSYTLSFKAKLSNQVYEINEFITFLKENSEKFNIDTSKIFLTGDSAGGQLIFLLPAISLSPTLQKAFDIKRVHFNKIDAIALNHAALYTKDVGRLPKTPRLEKISMDGVKRMLYGKNYQTLESFKYADGDEILALLNEEKVISSFPRTLILASSGDTTIGPQGEKLSRETKKYPMESELLFVDDESKGHIFNVLFPDWEESKMFNERIVSFFKESLDN